MSTRTYKVRLSIFPEMRESRDKPPILRTEVVRANSRTAAVRAALNALELNRSDVDVRWVQDVTGIPSRADGPDKLKDLLTF